MKKARTMFILFLLFTLATTAQTVLLQERFSNGVPENIWVAGFNGNLMEAFQHPGSPTGDGWVGRLQNNRSGGMVGQTSVEGANFGDFIYEAMVFLPVNGAAYYGLEFRVDPAGLSTGYQFVAAFNPSGTRRMRFRVRNVGTPATPTPIKDWSAGEIPGGIPTISGWHKLKVKAVGTDFWFYLNDRELPGCPVSDNSFFTGSVGAYIWDMSSPNHELLIDDIRVTASGPVGVDPYPVAENLFLSPVYPHPLKSAARVVQASFMLEAPGSVNMEVLDALGRRVLLQAMGVKPVGRHEASVSVPWLAAGAYRLVLHVNGRKAQRPFVVIR